MNVDVVQVKRDRPATSESDQGPPSKRNVKMGKKDIITTYNTTTEDDSVSPTTVGTTQRSGVVKEHFEDVTHIGTYEELEVTSLLYVLTRAYPFRLILILTMDMISWKVKVLRQLTCCII